MRILLLVSLTVTGMGTMHRMESNSMSSNNHGEEDMDHMNMITNLVQLLRNNLTFYVNSR
ncbi:hypothetical protein C5167_045121 [Papaver somniferum]|uniref:Uncharacterized protein n=1 Tax=Papaver somniferum TaxID=3469 RepID=A0A4Y7LDS5_PAPSO|nr:hypothetical protein C5167_045121 [Papaver somniferum]